MGVFTALSVFAVFVIGACRGPGPVEANSSSSSISVGEEIDFNMQVVGPGSYAVPPTLTGSAIEFLEVTSGGENPGGADQVFHFKAVASGITVITFVEIGNNTPGFPHNNVIDTVTVR
jgi:hypothetical protein